jgi:signal transduction histidine kinase
MDDTLEQIYRAGRKFLVPLSPEQTYETIIHEALKLADGHYGSIFLEENGELVRIYTSEDKLTKIRPRSDGYTYQTYRSGKLHLITAEELEKIHPTSRGMGIKSTVFVPISYRNHSIGVLSIHRTNDQNFTKKQLQALQHFGSYISLAIRKTQLNSELAEALKSRDLFIAMAAHELRTPLTSVSGYIQLLFNRYSSQETVEANWVKQLYWESIRLNKLAKELLEINQVRLGKLSFFWEERDLKEIIDRALTASNFVFPTRKITLKNSVKKPKAIIVGDFDKLIQVLTNILENAIKNSPPDSSIEVVFEEKKKYYTVCVIDKGYGIPKKDIKKIGQEFYKGENSRAEGMGLGLYLANYIIDHHKGELKIKSKLKVGTKVFINIPKLQDEPSRENSIPEIQR